MPVVKNVWQSLKLISLYQNKSDYTSININEQESKNGDKMNNATTDHVNNTFVKLKSYHAIFEIIPSNTNAVDVYAKYMPGLQSSSIYIDFNILPINRIALPSAQTNNTNTRNDGSNNNNSISKDVTNDNGSSNDNSSGNNNNNIKLTIDDTISIVHSGADYDNIVVFRGRYNQSVDIAVLILSDLNICNV